jgi:hypothetical protein
VKHHNMALIDDNTAYIDNEIIYMSNLMSLYYSF